MMRCPRCNGSVLQGEDLFCLACGERLVYGTMGTRSGGAASTWEENNRGRVRRANREYKARKRARKKEREKTT